MAPKKKPQTDAVLTIDTPFDDNGTTPREVIDSNAQLKKDIFGKWPDPFNKERAHFTIIDYDSFGYHKWFREFYALNDRDRTSEALTNAMRSYVQIRNFYLFERDSRLPSFKRAIIPLTEWCNTTRNGDLSIQNGTVMEAFALWFFETSFNPIRPDKNRAKYDFIRYYVSYWNNIMEIQGWYPFEPNNRKKSNDAVRLSLDPVFGLFRQTLYGRSNKYILENIKTVEEARNETKQLSPENVEAFVEYFNSIQQYKSGNDKKGAALRDFATLSFNFNLGLRGKGARNICYSWFKYLEIQEIVGGLYLNIGNPEGFKVRNLGDFTFTQFLVRHIDVRQCTIGCLIKIIVAEHDILRDTYLLDAIEKAIRDREVFVEKQLKGNAPSTPAWHEYKVLGSAKAPNIAVSPTAYIATINGAYEGIEADDMKAVGHEPHNRVPNLMLQMGVPSDMVSQFNAWTSGTETLFQKLYKHSSVDVQSALARGGYDGWKKKVYDCPRDGSDDDFIGFEDIRSKVLGGKVPNLMARARAVHVQLPLEHRLRTTILFLEMLDKFLIRVWLEDAAILQARYKNSICYHGHPVFEHDDWGRLQAHLKQLRVLRGEDVNEYNIDWSFSHYTPISQSNEVPEHLQEVVALMRRSPINPTIYTLYQWRTDIIKKYQQVNKGNRGIPVDLWEGTGNRDLYHQISNICTYIEETASSMRSEPEIVATKLQKVADILKISTQDFATTKFRILTTKTNNTQQLKLLKLPRETYEQAFKNVRLPVPKIIEK